MNVLIVILIATIALMVTPNASAWGRDAHAIISNIAEKHLSDKAKEAVSQLQWSYYGNNMGDDMTHTDKYHWLMSHHFVNVLDPSDQCQNDLENCTYIYERDCKGTYGKIQLVIGWRT